MIYTCIICDYKTRRAFDYERHVNRKTPCKTKTYSSDVMSEVNPIPQKVNPIPQKVNPIPQKVNPIPQKVNPIPQKVNVVICTRCNRYFTRHDNLLRHEIQCDGHDKLRCKVCLKLFSTKQGKWKHIQYVKCNPPTQINNITIHNDYSTHTNVHINNTQQYITNIRLSFGNEDVSKMCDDVGYMKRIEECVKMLKYAIPRSLEDVFFNDNYPENQTLKKDRRNDDMINVHIGDGKWENRLAQDTIDGILHTIQNYMDKYIHTVKLNPVASSRLKAFGKEMSKVQDWNTEVIENRLNIEPYDEPDDEDVKKTTKLISKLIKAKIYEKTIKLCSRS
jgi:hypothetical protein